MNGRSRDLLLLIILAAVVLVGAVVTVTIAPETPTATSQSTDRNGALALRLWLERSGFTVRSEVTIPADLDQTDVLFVLQPQADYTQANASAVREWVEAGHVLVIAGNYFSESRTLLWEFDLTLASLPYITDGPTSHPIVSGAPVLLTPPVVSRLPNAWSAGLYTGRTDVIPYLFRGSLPTLVAFPQGRGQVWVSSMIEPFTNIGLQDEQNARLVQNIIASLPAHARIGFDDGLYASENDDLTAWLFNSTPGRGLLLAGALIFVFFAAQGRRFGRPIPLPEEKLRREPVEHIQAIAYLFRRAGGRDQMLRHMQTRFRRHLSKRYGLDPGLSDAELIKQSVSRDPSLDETALRDLLYRLELRQVSESTLVQTAHLVDTWLRTLH